MNNKKYILLSILLCLTLTSCNDYTIEVDDESNIWIYVSWDLIKKPEEASYSDKENIKKAVFKELKNLTGTWNIVICPQHYDKYGNLLWDDYGIMISQHSCVDAAAYKDYKFYFQQYPIEHYPYKAVVNEHINEKMGIFDLVFIQFSGSGSSFPLKFNRHFFSKNGQAFDLLFEGKLLMLLIILVGWVINIAIIVGVIHGIRSNFFD